MTKDHIVFTACAFLLGSAVGVEYMNYAAGREPVSTTQVSSPGAVPTLVPAAPPYTACPKLRKGKWLRAEIAHWRKDGWVISCLYDGDQLMTRDEARL